MSLMHTDLLAVAHADAADVRLMLQIGRAVSGPRPRPRILAAPAHEAPGRADP